MGRGLQSTSGRCSRIKLDRLKSLVRTQGGVGMRTGKWLRGRRHLPYRPGDLTWDPLNLYESHAQSCGHLQT